jgi:hypothetical protein
VNLRVISPIIVAAAAFAGTIVTSLVVQTLRDPFPVVGEGVLASAYIAIAFVLARQTGWRRALSIGCSLSYPLWLMGLYVGFAVVGVLLGLNDEPLPGESGRQSFQDAARPALGFMLAALTLVVWLTVLTVCTRSMWIGLGIAALATVVLLLPDSPDVPVVWHGSLSGLLMLWAIRMRRSTVPPAPLDTLPATVC